ncbi:MAG: DUF2914 domain-containing protein [Alphaproteobacteria bacterium]|nr:DUF2914 domain-containing protein [Alphaproteobacteria bacterium]
MRFHLFLSSALVLASAGINFAQATVVAPDPSKQQAPAAEAVAPAPQSANTNLPQSAVPVTPKSSTAPAPAMADHNLTANRFVLATGVVNHEPQGAKDQFSAHDGHIFAFADLSSKGNDHVTFHWKKNGKTYHETKVSIKDSPRWRTYSKVIAHPGDWSVALVDSHGAVVKEVNFKVAADESHGTAKKPQAAPPADGQKQPESVKEVLQSLEPAKDPKTAKAN